MIKNLLNLVFVVGFVLAVALACNWRGNSYETGFHTTEAEKQEKAEREKFFKELEDSKIFVFDGGHSDLSISGNVLKVKNSAITFKDVQAFKERIILPPILNAKGIKIIEFDNGKDRWTISTR